MTTCSSADEILALDETRPDSFAAQGGDTNHSGSTFGGWLVAKALHAATRTVDDLPVSSLHAYFLAPVPVFAPLEFRVDRLRDSRRFANRQVTVLKDGRRLFVLACQFHAPEEGFEHQSVLMPDVPPPEAVPTLQDFVRCNAGRLDDAALRNFLVPLPIEIRPVDPAAYMLGRPAWPARDFWFRLPSAASVDDPRLQQCLLAYASDYWLGGVAAVPHILPTNSPHLLITSLDHALWFHRPARCEEWLFHRTTSPSAGGGLGLAQGSIFDRAGQLIATSAQESLLRQRRPI